LIDPEYLTKHYAGLSDEALIAVDRGELVESAQAFYDQEIERRGLRKDEVSPAVSTGPVGQVSPRIRHVKRAALVACIATVIGVAIPMWNSTRQMLALESNIGKLGAIAAILVGYVFTAIVPLFYFALSRNDGHLLVSRNMRRMAMTAAAVIGLLGVAAIPGWIGTFRGENVLEFAARPWTIGDTAAALGVIANLAGILPLVALVRLANDGSSERGVSVSRLLRIVTKVAVIAGGIVAVGCAVGVMATPWVYSYIRDRSLEMGYSNGRWTFSRLAIDRAQTALTVVCVYVAPFVVWRGSRMRVRREEDSTVDDGARKFPSRKE
jgi:hypothetical protein